MSSEVPRSPALPVNASAEVSREASRSNSFSQQSRTSQDSQTAAEFIREQEILEADAREALPYSIDNCTQVLGPLRQNVFACLTCNPPPSTPADSWTPAGVCYACSIQCHGEHKLVEIFQKRNFTCDCGTTRISSCRPCSLRINEATNTKGGVHSEEPDANNRYNQNFRNRFCGCECDYDPFQQKGTMFQCLGLGTVETGGCSEDWYHPGCVVGMDSQWYQKIEGREKPPASSRAHNSVGGLATIAEDGDEQLAEAAVLDDDDDDGEPPMPPGFPEEDDFEGFFCYKCVESNPWIKQYAGADGFLPAVMLKARQSLDPEPGADETGSRKRKAKDGSAERMKEKRVKLERANTPTTAAEDEIPGAAETLTSEAKAGMNDSSQGCKLPKLPAPLVGRFSLFFKQDFREKMCHCSDCYRLLHSHPQLLEEEEAYEPPLSDDGGGGGASQHGGSTHGSGSLLERGESALRNVDRVRAIEGVMAYNHLKERLKPFFQQFADSGQAVGAEDIKAYFAKLRGDEQGMREAGRAAAESRDDDAGSSSRDRREQSGY